jgi:salicylate hydroxylase
VRWSIWHHLNTSIYYNGLICLLGDSAHASTPHQAAGAGQCLEDALILSRLLARVEDRADTETAFKVYDSIRRPRAQKVVSTILDAGKVYNFSNAETGTDMNKILANLQERHLWIWEHDLEVDMMASEEEFDRLTIKQK